jgi:hypothetical protein
MENKTKKHYKLELPKESTWDRISYDPIFRLYNSREEWPSWVEKVFDLWFVPKRFVIELFDFFVRLKKWIPVLWKDRDWDDSFIFEIIKTKLITQRDYLVKNYRHTSVPEINRDITLCLNLIERFQESHYEIEYLDYFEVDFSFSECDDSIQEKEAPKLFEMKSETKRDDLIKYIEKYPLDKARTIKWINKINVESVDDYCDNSDSRQRLALYMSQYRHQKCKRLIFLILEQRIESWWD